MDDEPLAEPGKLKPDDRLRVAKEHFALSQTFVKGAKFYVSQKDFKVAAFELHQSLEQAYSCVLLTLTNYAPPSHNIKFLRSLAEEQDRRLSDAFPRDQHRERAWFNTLNEAYVKACYLRRVRHFVIDLSRWHEPLQRPSQLQELL